jgi:serine/threonine-protein kinase
LPALPPTRTAALASKRATTADRLRRQLRGDLETILGKAMKKDPAERYPSVAEFADDLRRYVDHQPISARRDGVRYRAAKFMRRHWRGLSAAFAAALVLVGVIGFYTVRLATERDRARGRGGKSIATQRAADRAVDQCRPISDAGRERANRSESARYRRRTRGRRNSPISPSYRPRCSQ